MCVIGSRYGVIYLTGLQDFYLFWINFIKPEAVRLVHFFALALLIPLLSLTVKFKRILVTYFSEMVQK